jgi:hypothetical protein
MKYESLLRNRKPTVENRKRRLIRELLTIRTRAHYKTHYLKGSGN